jgi:hypothetical protein
MPQNPYFVTATPPTARTQLINDIINRAVLITNIELDLQEHLNTESVDPEYVKIKNARANQYKMQLQQLLLTFFKDLDLNSVDLNAITQTVLDQTKKLELYKLYHVNESKQRNLMEQILKNIREKPKPKF